MADWLSYIPVVVTLAAGLLAVFFSKGGERARVRPIGYVFIALLVVSGAYSVYDLHSKAAERTQEKADRATAKAADDRRRAALEAQVQELGRVIQLESYDMTAPFSYGIFSIDLGIMESGESPPRPGFTGPFPTFGRRIGGEISVALGDIFSYRYAIFSDRPGSVTLSAPDQAAMTLRPDRLFCFQDRSGGCPYEAGPPADGPPPAGVWWGELAAPVNAYGLWLGTRSSVSKLASELLTAERYGQMIFEIPRLTQREYDSLVSSFATMTADFKFFVPLRNVRGRGDCTSVIFFPVRLVPAAGSSPRRVLIDLAPGQPRFRTDECEVSPF